jgi:uncharacterized membrane protein
MILRLGNSLEVKINGAGGFVLICFALVRAVTYYFKYLRFSVLRSATRKRDLATSVS